VSKHGLFGLYLIVVALGLSLVQKKVQEFMFMKTHATVIQLLLKQTSLKFNQKVCSILHKIDTQVNKDPSSNKSFTQSLACQLLEQTSLNVQTETLLNPHSSEFAPSVAFSTRFLIFNPMLYLTCISPARFFMRESAVALYNHGENSKLRMPKLKDKNISQIVLSNHRNLQPLPVW
jgi:hypothetical protein